MSLRDSTSTAAAPSPNRGPVLRSVLSSIRDIASTAHTITPPDSADSQSDSAEIIPYTKPLQAAVISKAKTSVGSPAFFAARCAIPGIAPPVELLTTMRAVISTRPPWRATSGAHTRAAVSSSGSSGSIHQRAATPVRRRIHSSVRPIESKYELVTCSPVVAAAISTMPAFMPRRSVPGYRPGNRGT